MASGRDDREFQFRQGSVSTSSPFAITWGTPVIYRSNQVLFVNFLNSNAILLAADFHLLSALPASGGNQMRMYDLGGSDPIGMAQSAAAAGQSVIVTLTGLHQVAGNGLEPGKLYFAHGEGGFNRNPYPVRNTRQRYTPTSLGIATANDTICLSWPQQIQVFSDQ